MIGRAAYDLLRVALRITVQLWPLWLFWFAWSLSNHGWLDYLLSFPDRSTEGYKFALYVWPTVALLGPILLMLLAVAAYRLQLTSRAMPVAGIIGVVVATALTGWPEYQLLAPYLGTAAAFDVLRSVDLRIPQAVLVGLLATIVGAKLTIRSTLGTGSGPRLVRGRSDNHGHADWLTMKEARQLFPAPDLAYGGIDRRRSLSGRLDLVCTRVVRPSQSPDLGPGRPGEARCSSTRVGPARPTPWRLRRLRRLQDHLHWRAHAAGLDVVLLWCSIRLAKSARWWRGCASASWDTRWSPDPAPRGQRWLQCARLD